MNAYEYPSNVEVHRWAEQQPWGHKVGSKAISRQLIRAWDLAHPDRPYVRAQAYHGTRNGYIARACRCGRCMDAWEAWNRDNYHSLDFVEGRVPQRRSRRSA